MTETQVLIVDDEKRVVDTYELRLQGEFETCVAYSGEGAVQILKEQGPEIDVVLLDRRMPDITGDEVARWIRDSGLNCRVALVTAVDPDYDIIQLGFDDYVRKPIESAETLQNLVRRLASQSSYDEHVRDHLSKVATKTALEEVKAQEELLESEKYIQLRSEIMESRRELDEALHGDVFVELLLKEIGSNVEVVIQYRPDSWQYRYVSESFEDTLGAADGDLFEFRDSIRCEFNQLLPSFLDNHPVTY